MISNVTPMVRYWSSLFGGSTCQHLSVLKPPAPFRKPHTGARERTREEASASVKKESKDSFVRGDTRDTRKTSGAWSQQFASRVWAGIWIGGSHRCPGSYEMLPISNKACEVYADGGSLSCCGGYQPDLGPRDLSACVAVVLGPPQQRDVYHSVGNRTPLSTRDLQRNLASWSSRYDVCQAVRVVLEILGFLSAQHCSGCVQVVGPGREVRSDRRNCGKGTRLRNG